MGRNDPIATQITRLTSHCPSPNSGSRQSRSLSLRLALDISYTLCAHSTSSRKCKQQLVYFLCQKYGVANRSVSLHTCTCTCTCTCACARSFLVHVALFPSSCACTFFSRQQAARPRTTVNQMQQPTVNALPRRDAAIVFAACKHMRLSIASCLGSVACAAIGDRPAAAGAQTAVCLGRRLLLPLLVCYLILRATCHTLTRCSAAQALEGCVEWAGLHRGGAAGWRAQARFLNARVGIA